jgi:adenylate kinase
MILILIGPPGSGKSTQSHLLVEALKLPFVSVGELIRKALKTEAFASYKKKVDEGNLLPDQVVFEVIQDKLEHLDLKKGFIMEGFPRTVGQAAWMDTFLQQKGAKVHRTLYLNTMGIDTIKHRILSRHQCSVCSRVFSLDELQGKVQCPVCSGDLYSRQDDHEEVLNTRIQQYHQQSVPVNEYYRHREVLTSIDASRSIQEVFASIIRELGCCTLAEQENVI